MMAMTPMTYKYLIEIKLVKNALEQILNFSKMPFANIRISKGSRILHGWYIHPIPYEMTIKDFFVKLITGELSPECSIAVTSSEIIERVELSETPVSVVTQVSINCGIIELTTNVGINIHYRLKTDVNIIISTLAPENSLM